MSREYPSHPLVGVGAIVFRGPEILLVKRGREPAKGFWGLPGGLLELGETVVEGIRREVEEECGIAVHVGPVVGVFEPMQRDDLGRLRFHFVVIDLLAEYVSGSLRAADDADDARWILPAELDGLPIQQPTLDMIRRAQALREESSRA